MEDSVELKPYGKTQRFDSMDITVTEKLDGTNGCIIIQDGKLVGVQSRTRFIRPGDDNFGFAGWAYDNAEALGTLGDGYHYGEWAGEGIQKNPHNLVGKQFFLFNVSRPQESLPDCVNLVPVLYTGPFQGKEHLDTIMDNLLDKSVEEGYTPEGIIIYWHSMRMCQKYTFNNNQSKWKIK